MSSNKGIWQWIVVVFIALAIAFLNPGCRKNITPEELIEKTDNNPLDLIFNFSVTYDSGKERTGFIGREDILNLTNKICARVHLPLLGETDFRYGDSRWIGYYSQYRYSVCVADLFMDIVNNPNGVHIERRPTMGDCQWTHSLTSIDGLQDYESYHGENSIEDTESNSNDLWTHIRFDPLSDVKQKEDIRHMALSSYDAARKRIYQFIYGDSSRAPYVSGVEIRTDFYENGKDKCFENIDTENADGPALADQMFSSLPSLVNQIANIKIDSAEEALAEGASRGDEWSSEDYGRLPALRHLSGSVTIDENVLDYSVGDNGEGWQSVPVFLGTQLPDMSNGLQNAISLLARYGVEIGSTLDIDSMRETANVRRLEIGLAPYASNEEMSADNGTSLGMLEQAYNYMYIHMLRFPRIPSFDEASGGMGPPIWANPYVKAPAEFFTKNFYPDSLLSLEHSEWYLSEWENLNPLVKISMSKKTGLSSYMLMELIKARDLSSFSPATGLSDKGRITESRLKDHLKAALSLAKNVLGKKRLEYRLVKNIEYPSEYSISRIILHGASFDENNVTSDRIRLYPLGNGQGVDSLSNFVCAHLATDGSEAACNQARESIIEQYEGNDIFSWCGVLMGGLGPQCGTSSDFELKLSSSKYWIVEYKTSDNPDTGTWKPIGVLSNDDYFVDEGNGNLVKNGTFFIGGKLPKLVERVLSFDEVDLKGSRCVPGLERRRITQPL